MTISYVSLALAIASGQLLYSIANTLISAGLSYILYLRQRPYAEEQERAMQALLADAYSRRAQQNLLEAQFDKPETVN